MANTVQYFENFRVNVRVRMDQSGITVREMAKMLGTSHPYVVNTLNGKVVPSIDRCEQFANALGVELPELLAAPKKVPA
jgi:transcriptional regulator with XRE-family HTH domain